MPASDNSPLAEPLNRPKPQVGYKFERPWHREAAGLAAKGFNHKEIAAMVEKSPVTVALALNQPAQAEMVSRTIAYNIHGEVSDLVEKIGRGAIVRLAKMSEDETLKEKYPKVYADVNQSFVDRLMGKAPQVIETKTRPSDMTDEEQDRRLAELRARAVGPEAVGITHAAVRSDAGERDPLAFPRDEDDDDGCNEED